MKKKNEPRTILIVDDEEENRRIYAEILNDLGYRTIEEPDGESALAAISAGAAVDLVIADYRMPGMNGLQFIESLRSVMPVGADDHGDRLRERGKLSAVLQPGCVRIHEQAFLESRIRSDRQGALLGEAGKDAA